MQEILHAALGNILSPITDVLVVLKNERVPEGYNSVSIKHHKEEKSHIHIAYKRSSDLDTHQLPITGMMLLTVIHIYTICCDILNAYVIYLL